MTSMAGSSEERFESLSKDKAKLFELLLNRRSAQNQIKPYPRREDAAAVEDLPSSWAQRRLWFIHQLEGGGAAYNLPTLLRLRGWLDEAALRAALDALVCRHEILRTVFVGTEEGPRQRILPESAFVLNVLDVSGRSREEREARARELQLEEIGTAFDLGAGPLFRACLLRLASQEHLLLLTMHHVISDGWSIGVLLRELAELYGSYCEGRTSKLEAMSIQYADYAQWQQEWLRGKVLEKQLNYWRGRLEGASPELELPKDRRRPAVQGHRGDSVSVVLDPQLTVQLNSFARRNGITLFMSLYAGWALLMSRLSGQSDVVIGTPVANRRRAEFEGLIGLFVNTLVLRVEVRREAQLYEFLNLVKEVTLGAYDHQDMPFEQVVEALRPQRSLNRHPIFQVMFALQSRAQKEPSFPNLSAAIEDAPSTTSKFDLLLALEERADDIVGTVNFDSDLFDRQTIERWVACFTVLLRHISTAESCALGSLPIVPDGERRMLSLFNSTTASYPQDKLIHQLFEAQVERTPQALAVICGDQYLTYRQLNHRANQLARFLRRHGVGADCFVALCVERGPEMIVGMMGILKAGGAYVPLDPNYPEQRLEYMLKDAAPRVLLTQERLKERVPQSSATTVAFDTQWDEIAQEPTTNLDVSDTRSSSLAYVIYTSGSTGRPKGVAIEHRNAVNMIWWGQLAMSTDVFEQTLHSTSLNFDLSVYECFVPLAAGGALRIVQNALSLLTERPDVTLINTVPSAIKSILDAGSIPATTRVVNLAGEPLKKALVDRIFESSSVECICNLYGPSETTTYSTWVSMSKQDGFLSSIGRPIANTQIYILDENRDLVPIGVTGEIYIGGAGVARGYLNQPELTADRFLPDHFSVDRTARMYKTGDLGRWRSDGTIEYLGRNDHQVKIRGFRIELGEIEAQIIGLESITETVVIAREDLPGEKRLVAYLVPEDPLVPPLVNELRERLKYALPEHMVPSAFVVIERLPLTPNGKLDRAALPVPELGAFTSREYEDPKGEIEEVLAGVWKALLHVERVGRFDNFFELGGHSLLIVQMMERLRRSGLSAELRHVFQSPTLMDLASALVAAASRPAVPPNLIPAECGSITPDMLPLIDLDASQIERIVQSVPGGASNIEDIYPLAPLQEGILFHHLLTDRDGDVYVIPKLLEIESRQRLDELIAALERTIARYDILRTAVLWEHLPQPVQVVYRRVSLPVETLALDPRLDRMQQVKEWMSMRQQMLDLRFAPPMRLRIAEGSDGQWYARLQLHHIVIDHVTIERLISEVVAHLEKRTLQLPEPMPYRNHVAQALAFARMHDAEAFFRGKIADIDEPTAPFGLLDVHGDGTQVREARQEVEFQLAQRIRIQARRLTVSAATLIHAAWALVVAHTSGRDDIVFGSVLLGRLHGDAGAQRTLGMFINTLPLRLRLSGFTAKELVEQTQRGLIELISHEQASLAVAQRCSGIAGTAPLFSVLLNYRHSSPNATVQWSGAKGIKVIAGLERTNYPITLSVDDFGDGFNLTAQTDQRIEARRMTQYLHTALQSLVDALERAPRTEALALNTLPEDELRQVVELFNAAPGRDQRHGWVHQLFEEQVERCAQTPAVVHGGRSLTYAEVNGRANRLARYLRARGVGADSLLAICMERTPLMVVALLAILKAGGAYVPLDPNYPRERLEYMLKDANPLVLLTETKLLDVLPVTSGEVIVVDAQWPEIDKYAEDNIAPAEAALTPQSLVYVIYTSGSTGRPKGTAMPHRAMMNLLGWHRETFGVDIGRRVLQFAALSFDVAFQEVFSTLSSGGTLVLLDEWIRRDAQSLLQLLSKQCVERLFVPPLMLQSLAEQIGRTRVELSSLRDVITAGEQLRITPEIVDFFNRLDGCRLHNHYGPTETHVVTALTLSGAAAEWPALPAIGYPIANTQIYVLDSRRQPTPLGVLGEIYIGGANVARAYLNRPELTAERFLPDPFSRDPQARMYRTGDLGRWRPDGTIDYQGRNDDQVKIRGFRIELGEIETQLAFHERVREAAVIAREDAAGEKRLVAYITLRDGSEEVADELRAFLKAALPEHMVPSAFVVLPTLPLTPSGKLDRRKLPAPDSGAFPSSQYERPQGKVEERLAKIWQELLHVGQVGRRDNFFDLGGHSLLVLRALVRINDALDCSLSVSDLYRNPTLRDLAARIGEGAEEDDLIDSSEAALDEGIVARLGPLRVPPQGIMLTGATGFVGRFLLAELLQDTKATIYCLVRSESREQAAARVRSTLAKWDLWRDEFESRIIAIPGDLRLSRLGVDDVSYRELAENVDSIYHCATSMNHLETYAMAKAANVEASRDVLRLATECRPKLVNYISTLGVFSSYGSEADRVVNEQTSIDDERHLQSRGYVGSKWVGEKIFIKANQRGIPCNIFRLGLVWADNRQGRYDELQRDYRIFKSCLLSGYGIRNHHYDLAPTPVDYVARSVVFLANRHHEGQGIFHIASGQQIIGDVFARCNEIAATSLRLLPYYDWICEMKRLHHEGQSLPIVPLIGFAFAMDAEAFAAHQRRIRPARIRFDCASTHRELEQAGIVAPVLDDDLLVTFLRSMLDRDLELREQFESRQVARNLDEPPLDARALNYRSGPASRPPF